MTDRYRRTKRSTKAILLLLLLALSAAALLIFLPSILTIGSAVGSPSPPAPAIVSSPPANTNTLGARFTFDDSQPGVTFECKLDDGAFAVCTSPKTYVLPAGIHTFRLRATAGDEPSLPTSYTWTIDTTAPTVTSIDRSDTSPTAAASVSWEVTFGEPVKGVDESDFELASSGLGGPPAITDVSGSRSTYTVTASTGSGSGSLGLDLVDDDSIEDLATNPLRGSDAASGSFSGQVYAVDRTPPPAPSITSSQTSSTAASFSFDDTEVAVAYLCKLDDGWFALCASPKSYSVENGSHTFSVKAVDPLGNVSASASHFWNVAPPPMPTPTPAPSSPAPPANQPTVDLTAPPAPSITAEPADPTKETSASFGFTDAEAGVTFLCKRDGGSFATCSSPHSYAGPLAGGSHTFSVKARDAAGNDSAPTSYTWTIDLTPPPPPEFSSTPPDTSHSSTASFVFGDSEAGVTFRCQLDIGVYATCTSPKSYTSLSDGEHTFYVVAVDAVGNVGSPASYTWTVDTSPPPAPKVTPNQPNPTNSTSIAFTLADARPGVTFQCSLDGSAFASCTSPKSYSGLGHGSHTFAAKALSGAIAGPATSYAWTVDTTAPLVTSIDRVDPSPTNAGPLHWKVTLSEPVRNVDIANFGLVTSGLAGSAPSITSVAPPSGSSATWTVTAATAGTTASNGSIGLNLTSKGTTQDAAGNSLGDSVPVVGQAYLFDTVAPGIPTITSGPQPLPNLTTTTTASFSFTGEPGVTFLCSLNSSAPADFSACSSPKSYSNVPQGTNSFFVKARDAVGNVGAPASRQWQVDTSDPPPPVNGSGQDFTITGDAVGLINPGGPARPIALRLHNPNDVPIYVTALTVTATTDTPNGCNHNGLVLQQVNLATATLSPNELVVPANGDLTLPAQNVAAPTIRLQNASFDQGPTCANQTFTLGYSGSAHS